MLSQKTGNPWTAERTTERVGCSALVIARSTIDPAAPKGQKEIAQGKAKHRPGIGVPETTQALKGRNRRRVNPCVMFRPFRAWANWGGLGELGRRRAKVAGVPRVALRSTLGYLIMPRWGERSRGKNSGTVPGVFQFLVVRRVRAAVPWSLDSSVAQTTKPQFEVKKRATHGPRNVPPSAWAVRLWLSRDPPSVRLPQRGAR